jgi:hypothetical protein
MKKKEEPVKKAARLILILVFSVFILSLNAGVKNENKPLKGEWNFQLEKVWEVDSAGEDVLVQARTIQVDDKGNIYLLEGKHSKFYVFSPAGKFLYSFGKRGEGPGEYKFVFNFFLEGKYVIVPDQGRIHYFTKEGKFVKAVNPGFLTFPRTFIDENRFIMIQSHTEEKKEYEELEIYDLNTKERSNLAEVVAEKSLTATRSSGGRRMVMQIKIGDATPSVVTTMHDNALYFGKNDKYLIKKIDLNGNELLTFSLQGKERKKIPLEYKKKRIGRISLNGGKLPNEMAEQIIKGMPDYSTYFSQITIEENGLIYVYISNAANETGQEIDIFSPGGKYLYHADIILPEGLIKTSPGPVVIKGNSLLVFVEDHEGETKLVKYKIVKP